MSHIPYAYARGLEAEGRHPHDAGMWTATAVRLEYEEGLPTSLTEHLVPDAANGKFGPTPVELRRAFRHLRCRYYRRVRTAAEAAALLARGRPTELTKVCLPLFAGWFAPADWIIPMPAAGEMPAPDTHAVRLLRAVRLGGDGATDEGDAPHFLFENSWSDWGLDGRAMLPFAYYDTFGFDQWSIYTGGELVGFRHKRLGPDLGAWQARDEFDRRVYAFEVGDPDRDRLGWAFAVETGGAIEMEELHVSITARRQGIGRRLADQVAALARAKGLPLRAWVSWADVAAESPHTAGALPALARRLGVQFHPSPVRWAGYFASSERAGSATPLEPAHSPGRPKSSRGAFAAFVLASGTTVRSEPAPTRTPLPAGVVDTVASGWPAQNARRAVLIRKKNRAGLTPAEQTEFDQLQAAARALAARTLPAPLLSSAERALVEQAGR